MYDILTIWLEIPFGISGSWVIDDKSFKVYRQVVACNSPQHVLVVPLLDIFNDIRRQLEAKHVVIQTTPPLNERSGHRTTAEDASLGEDA